MGNASSRPPKIQNQLAKVLKFNSRFWDRFYSCGGLFWHLGIKCSGCLFFWASNSGIFCLCGVGFESPGVDVCLWELFLLAYESPFRLFSSRFDLLRVYFKYLGVDFGSLRVNFGTLIVHLWPRGVNIIQFEIGLWGLESHFRPMNRF